MRRNSCQSYNVISNNPACVRAPRQSYRKYRYPFRDFYLIMEKPRLWRKNRVECQT